MELFVLLVNLIAIGAIISGIIIGAWWVVSLFWVHSRREERELDEIDLPGNLHEVFTGVPAALVITYIFLFIVSIAYVVFVWIGGVTY